MTTLYGREAKDVLTSNAPDFEELDEGQQAKYNHATCYMGEDTKNRLYVKNVDGAYLWHCHNCGDSGYYRPRETVARIKAASASIAVHKGKFKVPPAIVYTPSEFPLEAQIWLGEYGFTEPMIWKYKIGVCPEGVTLPIYDTRHVVSGVAAKGIQIRRYNKKPKYVTYTEQTYSYLGHVSPKHLAPLVIVEDLLSSYKLFEAGYDTLCLLGTKIDDKGLTILKNYARVVVWLDDDEAGHAASLKIFKEISPLVKDVTSINMEQPKEIPMESLNTMEL